MWLKCNIYATIMSSKTNMIFQLISPKTKRTRILFLGFYERGNLGDDSYVSAFPLIFQDCECIFQCTDDTICIPVNIDVIVVGGGDVINSYFMSRVEELIKDFTGPVYAFSVGIPYVSDGLKYLHVFDHVFVRNMTDYEIVKKEIGADNVSYTPDASMALWNNYHYHIHNRKRLGVCLAQPVFKNKELLESVAKALEMLPNDIDIHLFSFNTSANPTESDKLLNNNINLMLKRKCHVEQCDSVERMMKEISKCHVMLCTRFHSVMFSIIQKKRLIPFYVSKKIHNLLKDLTKPIPYSYKLPVDEHDMPIEVDPHILYRYITEALNDTSEPPQLKYPVDFEEAYKIIVQEKKTKHILVQNTLDTFENILSNCKRILSRYLDIIDYDDILLQRKRFPIGSHKPENVARLITYIVTGYVQNDYVWGLTRNLMKNEFCLLEAIDYIWKDMKKKGEIFLDSNKMYYPSIKVKRQVFVELDFIFQNNFASYHRSGWAFAIGGLMNIDAHSLSRASNTIVDLYVDRSFNWGMETMCTLGILPYKKPWIGFIHHTFDVSHSSFNCVGLFKNKIFLSSLKTCKCLIALTEYLAKQLRNALHDIHCATPVHVVFHPMEFVEKTFSIERFMKNPKRRVVQIGAWLRNPYSIYELPLYENWMNPLSIRKCALRGKDMDQYFMPHTLLEDIEGLLLKHYNSSDDDEGGISREVMCRSNYINKFCKGLYDNIVQKNKSVDIIEKLNNDEYDQLLSENIVFLDLVDCSAVNTVLEILVRNTPLIVNRHPAVEEILGESYPGFYENLSEAALLLSDINKIKDMSNYLEKLDKKRYTLDHFVNEVQKLCL